MYCVPEQPELVVIPNAALKRANENLEDSFIQKKSIAIIVAIIVNANVITPIES